ncbi:D(2) dopamine receptor A-like [Acanthaster planci]|uniref:D(2) dopamine receptor A-like n=1 Tax=Acanthaster planci TaxID=133434 RepID=A0A8B7YBB3_ACAPL|nr:D(2) dopamine receptor A-like [Acanthaster planci]XP_022090535.1 D(2) dopamine receptor A-like [Acanthaster planci]
MRKHKRFCVWQFCLDATCTCMRETLILARMTEALTPAAMTSFPMTLPTGDALPLLNSTDMGFDKYAPSLAQENGNNTQVVSITFRNETLLQTRGNLTSHVGSGWSMTVNIVLMAFFMVAGILGNLLVIMVYLRNRWKRQSTANYFLCSLAVVDLIVCTVAIPIQLHLECSAVSRLVVALECAVFAYVWHVVMFTSAWMLVGISVDRYYCLCRPFNRRTQVRRVTYTILFIWSFTIVVSIPFSLLFEDQCRYDNIGKLPARLGVAMADSLISLLIPLFIIAMAYLKIFYVISQRNNDTQNESHGQKIMHHTRFIVAKRLLLVIGAFVLCWMPRMIAEIYSATLEPDVNVSLEKQALYICQTIVPYFNSILNPILYSLINPRFRHECQRLLLTCFGKVLPMPAAAAKYTCRSSSAL